MQFADLCRTGIRQIALSKWQTYHISWNFNDACCKHHWSFN